MQVLSFSSPKLSTRNMVYMAMLMAMQIVLGRFSFGTLGSRLAQRSLPRSSWDIILAHGWRPALLR